MLKPQDILVILRLLIAENRKEVCTYPILSGWTGLSASEAHAAIKRAVKASLAGKAIQDAGTGFEWAIMRPALDEFMTHAIRFLWPLELGAAQRGVVTGTSVEGINQGDRSVVEADTWVWPHASGTARGVAVKPLYPSAPAVAVSDVLFHQALAAVDLARSANHRLRRLGIEWLQRQLIL
jgi:hypothetical protein